MPTVAILYSYKASYVPGRLKTTFVIFDVGHSDAQGWPPECPDVKNYKWRFNPVWHRMLHRSTHMAIVGIKGLTVCKLLLFQCYLINSFAVCDLCRWNAGDGVTTPRLTTAVTIIVSSIHSLRSSLGLYALLQRVYSSEQHLTRNCCILHICRRLKHILIKHTSSSSSYNFIITCNDGPWTGIA